MLASHTSPATICISTGEADAIDPAGASRVADLLASHLAPTTVSTPYAEDEADGKADGRVQVRLPGVVGEDESVSRGPFNL